MAEDRPTPEQETRRLYEEAESRVAKAAERVVSRESFGELLAMATENVVALTRMGFDAMDLVWSNLRLAGRRDITRLARQLGRTEDKLEQVLQEVERLREQRRALERQRRQARGRREGGGPGQAGVGLAAHPLAMNALERMARSPVAALEFANIVLTERDAQIAVTPKDVVWTHRTTTLYRYRSTKRTYAVPVLLVFALINRPDIFDLRPGNSFVEFLLDEGYDVFLLDWGVPDEADADLGLEHYVCDEIPSALREVRRASGQEEATLLGWCIGGTLVAAALRAGACHQRAQPRPAHHAHRHDRVALRDLGGARLLRRRSRRRGLRRGAGAERRLGQQAHEAGDQLLDDLPAAVAAGPRRRGAARRLPVDGQVGGGQPAVPGARLSRVDHLDVQGEPSGPRAHAPARAARRACRRCEQNLLVVTAGADHIAPREGTLPVLDQVASADVTHLDRPGGHIGLMAGSKARKEVWPHIAEWLASARTP